MVVVVVFFAVVVVVLIDVVVASVVADAVVVVVVVSVVVVAERAEETVVSASVRDVSEEVLPDNLGRYEGRDLMAFAQPVVKKAAAMTNAAVERRIILVFIDIVTFFI